MNSRPLQRFLRILLAPILVIALALAAVWLLGPSALEGLIQRQVDRLARDRGIAIGLEGLDLAGLKRLRVQSVHLSRGTALDLEARDVEMVLRPLGLILGGRGIESIEVAAVSFRVGDEGHPPKDWKDLLGTGDGSREGPAVPPGGMARSGRWPDVHVASVTGTIRTPRGTWVLREGEARIEAVAEVLRAGERRFRGRFRLDHDSPIQADVEAHLGPEGLQEVQATLDPPLEMPLHSGMARLGGVRWTPETLALLDLGWEGPGGQRLRVPRVSVAFEAPTGTARSGLPAAWRPLEERLFPGRQMAFIEVEKPLWQWIPRPPIVVPNSGAEDAGNGKGPAAWLARASRRTWMALDGFREQIGRIGASVPRIPVTIQGASFHPLEPGALAPEPGRSLANVGAVLRWTPEGAMTLEMRLDCPDAAPGTVTWTLSPDLDRWTLAADLRDLPLDPWRFLWGGQGGPSLLRTARLTLEVDHGARRVSGSGELALGGWSIGIPAVASAPLSFQDVALSGRLEVDPNTLTLTDAEFRSGRLVVPLSIRVTGVRESPRFQVQGTVQRIAAADLVASLPPELLGSLQGMRLAGTFAGRFDLDIDTAHLDSVRLDLQPDVSDLQVLSLGDAVDLGLLRSVFLHQIEETDGTVVQRLVGEDSPFWVPLSAMPPWLVPALTMAEDATFFRHQGFSLSAIRRSLRVNLERGGFVQGASTLSQQLAKNLFLSREKTLARKVQEALLTWQLEKTLTKERILELYLNIIEWGPEVFGLREAAGHYFAKRPEELTPMETALLVVMIPGPRVFHDLLLKQGRPPALYRARAEALIRELGRQMVLTPEQVEAALAETPRFAPVELAHPPPVSDEGLGYEPSPMPPAPEPF